MMAESSGGLEESDSDTPESRVKPSQYWANYSCRIIALFSVTDWPVSQSVSEFSDSSIFW